MKRTKRSAVENVLTEIRKELKWRTLFKLCSFFQAVGKACNSKKKRGFLYCSKCEKSSKTVKDVLYSCFKKGYKQCWSNMEHRSTVKSNRCIKDQWVGLCCRMRMGLKRPQQKQKLTQDTKNNQQVDDTLSIGLETRDSTVEIAHAALVEPLRFIKTS